MDVLDEIGWNLERFGRIDHGVFGCVAPRSTVRPFTVDYGCLGSTIVTLRSTVNNAVCLYLRAD